MMSIASKEVKGALPDHVGAHKGPNWNFLFKIVSMAKKPSILKDKNFFMGYMFWK